MIKYNPSMHGAADYNQHVLIPNDDWDGITQAGDDIDPFRQGKFAQLVHVVNDIGGGGGTISLSASDIQIGAVEIKNGDDDTRMDVISSDNYNSMASSIVDTDGNQIENIQTFGVYNTTISGILDGLVSTATTTNPISVTDNVVIRLKSYDGDNWVQVSPTVLATVNNGLLLLEGDEVTLLCPAGSYISTIGGRLNIVSITV